MKTPLFLLLIFSFTLLPNSVKAEDYYRVNANKLCSVVMNVPYASDDLTDEQWADFLQCKEFLKYFADE